jgi:hypothetical protein
MDMLSNKIRYIREVRNHDIDIMEPNLMAKLTDKGYTMIGDVIQFAHLLEISVRDLRTIDIEELSRSKDGQVDKLAKLEKVTGVDLWIHDLEELLEALNEVKVTAPRDSSRKRPRSPEVEAISCRSAPQRVKDSLQQDLHSLSHVHRIESTRRCRPLTPVDFVFLAETGGGEPEGVPTGGFAADN